MGSRTTPDVDHFEIKDCRRTDDGRIEYQVVLASEARVWKEIWVPSETKELTAKSRLVFLEKLPRDHWIFKEDRLSKVEQLRALADVEHVENVLHFLVEDGNPTKLKDGMDRPTLDEILATLPTEFEPDAGINEALSEVIDSKKQVRAQFEQAGLLSDVERWNLEADLNVKSKAEKKLITLCPSIKEEDAKSLKNFTYSDDIVIPSALIDSNPDLFKELDPCSCTSADECGFGACEHYKAYHHDGRLKLEYLYNPMKKAIHECHSKCKCDSSCPNRVVQNGSFVSKEIFSTRAIGLGVRTNEFVRRGTFVGSYAGNLIENESARGYYTFSVQPMLSATDKFSIDAEKLGNITRLLNHSCEPNLIFVNVHTKYSSRSVHEVAFFAARDIRQGEELYVSYGDKYFKRRGMDCLCPKKRGIPHPPEAGELQQSTRSMQNVC